MRAMFSKPLHALKLHISKSTTPCFRQTVLLPLMNIEMIQNVQNIRNCL